MVEPLTPLTSVAQQEHTPRRGEPSPSHGLHRSTTPGLRIDANITTSFDELPTASAAHPPNASIRADPPSPPQHDAALRGGASRPVATPLPGSAGPGVHADLAETEAHVSALARQLATLAATAISTSRPAGAEPMQTPVSLNTTPIRLAAGEPLLAEPPRSAHDIATALPRSIAESGLFYEAHQAAWIRGALSGDQMRRESGLRTLIDPPPASAARADDMPVSEPSSYVGTREAPSANDVTVPQQGPAQSVTGANLVARQLDVLATQQYCWQGQLVPGQPFQLSIDDPRTRQRDMPEAQQAWHSRLDITLPRLGRVVIDIRLAGPRLELRIDTEPAQRAQVSHARPDLDAALAAAGLVLADISLGHV
ncbi:MAG: hypothetical protein IOMNBAOH_02168 [Rhodocyclaceae bacterium]|nr:hypothetical protein [Rhodocyclaceae bacterium]